MKIIKKLFLFAFLLTFFYLSPTPVLAEEIRNFDTVITAHQNGTMEITETIQYDFGSADRHGIFRDIPLVSRVGDLYRQLQIQVNQITRDGQNENNSISDNGSQVSIKIGNANKTINGLHTYVINYQVKNGIGSNYADHDEIFWNATGNDWPVTINQATISFQTDFSISPTKAACYTGPQGSALKNCTVPASPPFSPIKTTQPLPPSSGLSAVIAYPFNTFPKSTLSDIPPSNYDSGQPPDLRPLLIVLAVAYSGLNFIFGPALLIWYFTHKRKNRFGAVTVNFGIPKTEKGDRLPPAEAGIIDNATLEQNDITAIIFDLAVRKYLRLVDKESEHSFMGIKNKSTNHTIEKLRSNGKYPLNDYEQTLMDRLFRDGDSVKIDDLSSDFYETFAELEKSVFSALVVDGYYKRNPKAQRALLLVGGILSLVSINLILGPVLLFLSQKLNGRTQTGDLLDWQIDGLKLFLKNMSREYKWQAKNLITVETYIPYAMALGYINEFMAQLKVIYPDYHPTWYIGNNFYLAYPLFYSSMSSHMTTVAPSHSSGFSGGGFSGGGGGGGGGGSW